MALETNDQKEKFIELSKNKRATVRKFKNMVLLDIREYYDSQGTLKPGKKGISLTREQWDALMEHKDAIEEAMVAIEEGEGPMKKTKTSSEVQKNTEKEEESKATEVKSVKTEVKREQDD